MDRLRNKYNPSYHYLKAEDALEHVTQEEAVSWYKHPCTASLRNSLEGDMAAIVATWLGGGYSEESSTDGTAQRQAKARGMAQALDDMLEHIEQLKTLKLEGEEIEDGKSSY